MSFFKLFFHTAPCAKYIRVKMGLKQEHSNQDSKCLNSGSILNQNNHAAISESLPV